MTLEKLALEIVKLLAKQVPDIEVVSSVAELELPIHAVRVVDLLPQPGGQVVQFVTRMDGPPVEFSTEPGTETTVEHSPALLDAVASRLRSAALMEMLARIVVAWDVLQPCVLTTNTQHDLTYLTEAISAARKVAEDAGLVRPQ
jgi:hypothetical protein